jgi:hypothetical protein
MNGTMTSPARKLKRKATLASPLDESEPKARLKSSLDRILSEIKQPPPNLDRNALLSGLELCVRWYCDAQRFGHKKPVKNQRSRLDLIEKTAKRLQVLLTDDILATMDRTSTMVHPREFLAELTSAVQKARDPLPLGDLQDFLEYVAGFRQRSPLEWLAGYCLRDIYELHCRRKATPTLTGEYVRFVEIFMDVLHITVPPRRGRSQLEATDRRATISRALTSVRSGRSRRKILPGDWTDAILQNEWWWASQLLYFCGVKWDHAPSLPMWDILNNIEAQRNA